MEDRKVGLPEGLASIDLTYSFYPQTLVAHGGTITSAFLVSRCFFFQRLSLDIVSESLKEKIASMQSSATCGFHTNTSKRYVQNESAGYTCPAFQVPVSINCQHGAISRNVSI